MNIENFSNNISPNNISQVSTSGGVVREKLEGSSSIILSSFLTGSYIRYTKIDPIDDLDIFFKIHFGDTYYVTTKEGIYLYLKEGTYDNHKLKDFTFFNEGTKRHIISPIKIINHIGSIIEKGYPDTEEKGRNGECYSVFLSSYNLTIDCVPYGGVQDKDFLLIPKGGNNIYWKKTNPKIDEDEVNKMNKEDKYNKKFKGLVKVLKYWNKNKNTTKKFKSYILESLIYHAFNTKCNIDMEYPELLKTVLSFIYDNVENHCNILDIPRYDYMHYKLDSTQKDTLKRKISEFYNKLESSEDDAVEYLKSN